MRQRVGSEIAALHGGSSKCEVGRMKAETFPFPYPLFPPESCVLPHRWPDNMRSPNTSILDNRPFQRFLCPCTTVRSLHCGRFEPGMRVANGLPVSDQAAVWMPRWRGKPIQFTAPKPTTRCTWSETGPSGSVTRAGDRACAVLSASRNTAAHRAPPLACVRREGTRHRHMRCTVTTVDILNHFLAARRQNQCRCLVSKRGFRQKALKTKSRYRSGSMPVEMLSRYATQRDWPPTHVPDSECRFSPRGRLPMSHDEGSNSRTRRRSTGQSAPCCC